MKFVTYDEYQKALEIIDRAIKMGQLYTNDNHGANYLVTQLSYKDRSGFAPASHAAFRGAHVMENLRKEEILTLIENNRTHIKNANKSLEELNKELDGLERDKAGQ